MQQYLIQFEIIFLTKMPLWVPMPDNREHDYSNSFRNIHTAVDVRFTRNPWRAKHISLVMAKLFVY